MINLRSANARRREWQRQTRMSLAFERGLSPKLRREFRAAGLRAADQYRSGGNVDEHQIQKHHAAALAKILRPYYLASAKVFASNVRTAFGKASVVAATKMTEEELNTFMHTFVNKWMPSRVEGMSKSTMKHIANSIAYGRENEMTTNQIADRIVERTGGEIGDARARTIARTEIHAASQAGSVETAKSFGIPGLRKQWNALMDERTRSDHADVSGDTVDMEDTFSVGEDQLEYPGDPNGSPEETVNCRCICTFDTTNAIPVDEPGLEES